MSLDVRLTRMAMTTVFDYNITHNLGAMAREAGVYKYLWRPEELNIKKASELIEPLEKGLNKLLSNPEYFKKFNPVNGWGNYDNLVEFLREYIKACKENKNAKIFVSR